MSAGCHLAPVLPALKGGAYDSPPFAGLQGVYVLGMAPNLPVCSIKEPMETKLQDYRRQVDNYFEMEFSDVPLEQVLLRLPEKYSGKVDKLIRLFHSLKRPPSDAAGRAMRFLRPPFRSLIVGQKDER